MRGHYLPVFWCLLAAPAFAEALPEAHYCIHTKRGQVQLFLQIADTPQARARGLMGRDALAPYDGMFFPLDAPRHVQMWMKDTPLSLDMLFVDAKGKLVHIAPNTEPYSESVIDPKTLVASVIELEAGRAQREGIHKGDRLHRGACAELRPER